MGMRIAISGASGLIGSRLTTDLTTNGHDVLPLVRREAAHAREIAWNPEDGAIEADKLAACDAIIHLAGENVAGGRWSDERKQRILDSREKGTRLIAETLAGQTHKPKLFLSASAIGFYGNRPPDETCTEQSEAGQGFLAEVCELWEASTQPAKDAGIRTVNLRIGVVLSALGGALKKMLPPFKLGLGGVVGNGRQMMSWVSLDDVSGIVRFLLEHPEISGPVNAVSPQPVDNGTFTLILGNVLRRPTIVPVPGFALKLAYGEMARETVLGGVRVMPQVLLDAGYAFRYPDLEKALKHAL